MPETTIDLTARVHESANVGLNCEIGPYCIVGPDVELEDGVVLDAHVVVRGRTRIGARTQVFSGSVIGNIPQDRKYDGEPSQLVIGADCVIREHVTINTGTAGGGMLTRIGDGCLIMAGAHIGHDCIVGNQVIIVNHVLLGGHVDVGDFAVIGGQAAVHQFVRIGAHAMIGGMTGVEHDVIPFGLVTGNRATLDGLNLIGMKRRSFGRGEITRMQELYRFLFHSGRTLRDAITEAPAQFENEGGVGEVLSFLGASSRRSFTVPSEVRLPPAAPLTELDISALRGNNPSMPRSVAAAAG